MHKEGAAPDRSAVSYLYVIAPVEEGTEPWAKIGHSVNPAFRRNQLQTGNGEKLAVAGKWPVPRQEAIARERGVKAALAPLRLKGEVFRAPAALACLVVERIAAGEELDAFLKTAIRNVIVEREWTRVNRLPSSGGAKAKPETVAELKAIEDELDYLHREMCRLDIVRTRRIDPWMVDIAGGTAQ